MGVALNSMIQLVVSVCTWMIYELHPHLILTLHHSFLLCGELTRHPDFARSSSNNHLLLFPLLFVEYDHQWGRREATDHTEAGDGREAHSIKCRGNHTLIKPVGYPPPPPPPPPRNGKFLCHSKPSINTGLWTFPSCYSETCPCDHLYSETTSIQRLG